MYTLKLAADSTEPRELLILISKLIGRCLVHSSITKIQMHAIRLRRMPHYDGRHDDVWLFSDCETIPSISFCSFNSPQREVVKIVLVFCFAFLLIYRSHKTNKSFSIFRNAISRWARPAPNMEGSVKWRYAKILCVFSFLSSLFVFLLCFVRAEMLNHSLTHMSRYFGLFCWGQSSYKQSMRLSCVSGAVFHVHFNVAPSIFTPLRSPMEPTHTHTHRFIIHDFCYDYCSCMCKQNQMRKEYFPTQIKCGAMR